MLSAVPRTARSTPTCCCRSRRSPRPPARSSTARAACRASTASCKPLGETRPGWKVLRVLGTMLGLPASTPTRIERGRATSLPDAPATSRRGSPTRTRRGDRRAGAAAAGGSSASPTCRSTSPIRWCAARRRCSRPRDARPPQRADARATLLEQLGRRRRRAGQGAPGPRRGGADRGRRCRGARRACVRIAAAHPSTCGLEACPARSRVERALTMDALARAGRSSSLGPAWLPRVDAASRSSRSRCR